MSIIIDANRAGDFSPPVASPASEILRRVLKGTIRIVVGGRLLQELQNTRFFDVMSELGRSGLLVRVCDNAVEIESEKIFEMTIKSDDPHVLALIKLSDALILFTEDRDLIDDVRCGKFVRRIPVLTTRTAKGRLRLLLDRCCP